MTFLNWIRSSTTWGSFFSLPLSFTTKISRQKNDHFPENQAKTTEPAKWTDPRTNTFKSLQVGAKERNGRQQHKQQAQSSNKSTTCTVISMLSSSHSTNRTGVASVHVVDLVWVCVVYCFFQAIDILAFSVSFVNAIVFLFVAISVITMKRQQNNRNSCYARESHWQQWSWTNADNEEAKWTTLDASWDWQRPKSLARLG